MTAVVQGFSVRCASCTTILAPLHQISLPESRSRILSKIGGRVSEFSIHGGGGWFPEDVENSLSQGRELCDRLINKRSCRGFLITGRGAA
jgi:hypothetical protein